MVRFSPKPHKKIIEGQNIHFRTQDKPMSMTVFKSRNPYLIIVSQQFIGNII